MTNGNYDKEWALNLVMIRHFKTPGNLEKRYIGSTDESICEEGKQKLHAKVYPPVEAVFASPLKRCIETAKLIYPDLSPISWEGYQECDFGDYENKNYEELKQLPGYQAWINSNGELPFPGGESKAQFKQRCINAFQTMVEECKKKNIIRTAVIVHGGTIMSILDQYSNPHEDFYHWQVGNGEGFQLFIENGIWRITKL